MSPIEGCPTVFQVIWSLAPGYHQVKIDLMIVVAILMFILC